MTVMPLASVSCRHQRHGGCWRTEPSALQKAGGFGAVLDDATGYGLIDGGNVAVRRCPRMPADATAEPGHETFGISAAIAASPGQTEAASPDNSIAIREETLAILIMNQF